MHDREFEKDVQNKMHDLRFKPSPDVWARVQADIVKKKRRRPVVIWFLFGALLTGGAMWLSIGKNGGVNTADTISKADVPSQTKQATVKQSPVQQGEQEQQPQQIQEQQKQGQQRQEQPLSNKKSSTTPIEQLYTETAEPVIKGTIEVATTKIETIDPALEHSQPRYNSTEQPLVRVKQPTIPPVQSNNKKTPATTNKNNWQWGITAGAGISDLGKDPFKNTRVADLASMNIPSALYTPTYRPSQVTAGLAINVGAYVSKGISKKLRLKLGINYENYSNQIKVGSYVDSAKLLNQGQGNYRVLENFYTPGNTNNYTNKYHFISLPASIQWQLNRNDKRSIIWENGIAFSRLLASSALQYDGASAAYFKDNSVIRKSQWMVSSSVLFSIKTKNNMQWYAGPQIQYGLSNLVNNDALSGKHVRYAGIKLAVGFNKN